jgi:very-short-patch-repair endonuclease
MRTVDLYDEANRFPATLRGAMSAASIGQLRRSGLPGGAVKWRARHNGLVRAHRGMYLTSVGRPDLLDWVHAALAVCPRGTVVGYQTAAALLGFGIVPSDRVHVVIPTATAFPQRTEIRVHQSAVPVGPPTIVCGVPCTPAARTAIDLARHLRRSQAMAVLDCAMRSASITHDELASELALHKALRGVKQARGLVPLADPRAQCRQESELRLILIDGGLKDFEPQVPVVDDAGYPRYYLDLGDVGRRIGAEYDGSSHLDRGRMRADRTRHNWLTARGWTMRYFTDLDLYNRRGGILETLRQASVI